MQSSEGFKALLVRGVEWAAAGRVTSALPHSHKGKKG
jgi:hypothetical protein